MTDHLPEGSLIKVELEVRLPTDATWEQIHEWVELELGCGGASIDNPLLNYGVEAWGMSLEIDDTGMIGSREEIDVQATANGRLYRVRYRRHPRPAPAEATDA